VDTTIEWMSGDTRKYEITENTRASDEVELKTT
jgi:hypothetical protein